MTRIQKTVLHVGLKCVYSTFCGILHDTKFKYDLNACDSPSVKPSEENGFDKCQIVDHRWQTCSTAQNKPVKYKTFPLFYNEYKNKYHYAPSLISYVSMMYTTFQQFWVSKNVLYIYIYMN